MCHAPYGIRRGFTLVEIMMVVVVIALLAAIAVPNVLRGRTTANESSAIGNLRALVSSLEMALAVNDVYPLDVPGNTWVVAMYGACPGGAGAPDPDFGPPSFCNTMAGGATPATGLVRGFSYTYAAGAVAGATYTILAVPAAIGTTGTRTFFVNEVGLMRHCQNPPAGTVANGPTWNTIDQVPTNPCT